jgi:hypothetical protein
MLRTKRLWMVFGAAACVSSSEQPDPSKSSAIGDTDTGEQSDLSDLDDTGMGPNFDGDTGSGPDLDDDPTEDPPPRPDPFSPRADTTEGLVNTDSDLLAVLEGGDLRGACDAYAADRGNRRKELLCGKEMFFYESFGTAGVPRGLVDILLRSFEEEVFGEAFEAYGLVPDPTSPEGYPLGMTLSDDAQSVVFTCASCHFAPMSDGRFAVGAPNHNYAYGEHNLALGVFPLAATGGLVAPVDPLAEEKLGPLLDAYWADWGAQAQLVAWMLTMLGQEIPQFTTENQRYYAQWLPGTMDFFIEPLPIDDGVHTVSKIQALWGIPTPTEEAEAGMDHAMLGCTGNTRSLNNFARAFAALGGGDADAWGPEEVAPLVAYIESLDAPEPPATNPEAVQRGEDLFFAEGCIDCHSGPRGSGLTLFSFDELGTDDAMRYWMDPEADGTTLPGVDMGEDTVTNALKSPRLVGLWTMERFLHNGAVGSLDELLCVDGERPAAPLDAMGNGGHTFGCETLSWDEKEDLIEYLESH